jgi:WbqC-like protein family
VAGAPLCAIHQPNFFPRLSTLAKIFTADIWVVLDDVQFARRDYQHRCRLAASTGAFAQRWLTVPVHLPSGRATLIRDIRIIDPATTRQRVARLLKQYYRRSPHWAVVQDPLQEVLDTFDHTDRLAEISQTSTVALLRLLGWPGAIRRSTDLPTSADRSGRLAELTCTVGAGTYLCGTGGAHYLDPWPFAGHRLTTAMFTTPDHGDPRTWQAARRITALHPLLTLGPDIVGEELRHHAYGWPAGTQEQPKGALSAR